MLCLFCNKKYQVQVTFITALMITLSSLLPQLSSAFTGPGVTTTATTRSRQLFIALSVHSNRFTHATKTSPSTSFQSKNYSSLAKLRKNCGLSVSSGSSLRRDSTLTSTVRRNLSSIPEMDAALERDINKMTTEYPLEMTEDERYLFDLNGYLIIRGVLTPDEVQLANEIIDKHQQQMIERKEAALRNAVKGTEFYGSGPGRKDLGGVLEWGEDSKIFKRILAHPRLVPLFHGILGKGKE